MNGSSMEVLEHVNALLIKPYNYGEINGISPIWERKLPLAELGDFP